MLEYFEGFIPLIHTCVMKKIPFFMPSMDITQGVERVLITQIFREEPLGGPVMKCVFLFFLSNSVNRLKIVSNRVKYNT